MSKAEHLRNLLLALSAPSPGLDGPGANEDYAFNISRRDSISSLQDAVAAAPRLTYLRRPYPGNSTIDIQHGPLPNGTVSDKVSVPESGLTLNIAIWPESWPAE